MKHNYAALLLLAMGMLLAPLTAQAQQNTRRPARDVKTTHAAPKITLKAADGTEKTAYGVLGYDDTHNSWANGLVSFPLSDGDLTLVRLFGDADHDVTAGAYANGYYYYERTQYDESGNMIPVDLWRYDIDANRVDSIGELTAFQLHINDMTYDHSTGTMYAISRPTNGNSALYTINLETAESELTVYTDKQYFTLACTYQGQLYGITFDGDLCKINKQTGVSTVIGETGYHPTYIQSMEFDHDTETLYWAADLMDTDISDCIAQVDTLDGVAMPLGQVGDSPEIQGLYIPYSISAPGTPAAVSALTVTPDAAGKNQVQLSWTNPTTTCDGKELTAITAVTVLRNKEVVYTAATTTPGQQISVTDQTPDGPGQTYTYTVYATNEAGNGAESKQTVFVGHDTPAAITGLTLTQPEYDEAQISWDATTTGINGGYVDTASLTYTLTRMPDGTVLSTSLTEPRYTDSGITATQEYYYQVKAVNADGESATAETAHRVLGPAYTMPFSVDFTAATADNSWTVVDGNGDGYAWLWTTTSTGTVMGHQASNTAQADDWLMSYYIPFEAGKRYRVDYRLHAYSTDHLDFYLLDKMDYASPVQTLTSQDIKGGTTIADHVFSFTAPESGYYNLALHATSPMRADWLELYSLSIREAEKYNLAASSLEGPQQPMIGEESTYSFTVANLGSTKTYGFNILLHDQDGNELARKSVAKTLQPGDETTVSLPWTPASTDVTALVAEVVLMDSKDLNDSDNTTDTLAVQVREAYDGQLVSIGTSSTTLGSSAPFDLSNQHAAALNIYSADEIGSTKKYIDQVAWIYDAVSQYSDVVDAPVKIYMANTDLTASTEWMAEEDMTLVYDGKLNIVKKTSGELTIELGRQFEYESGKNLAVLTTVDCDSYYPYVYFRQYTSPLTDNCSFEWGSYYATTGFDFTQTGHKNWYNRTPAIMLYLTDTYREPSAIADLEDTSDADYTVYDLSGRQLTQGRVSQQGTIDTNALPQGIYVVSMKKDGHVKTQKISIRH